MQDGKNLNHEATTTRGCVGLRAMLCALLLGTAVLFPLGALSSGEARAGPTVTLSEEQQKAVKAMIADIKKRFGGVDVAAATGAQGRLMHEALSALAPQRPGISDLYFLGFGSFAYEDVFWNEVRSVRALFDDRFDTANRSLALINNLESLEELPLASKANLRESLNAIGRKIDADEDIVFLFLTSHGSPDHRLAVSFWPIKLDDLTPQELDAMLDEAGIKWRVIVISACYSGGFLDVLKDEHSLIMTAARRDRPSFGCGNHRGFTYFGEAYFNQELRTQQSFLTAFTDASAKISKWEQAQGMTPSVPQLHLGTAIAPRLSMLQRRLDPRLAAFQVGQRLTSR